MATPFAPTHKEMIELWNDTLEQLNVPSEQHSEVPEDATALRYPKVELGPNNTTNIFFGFITSGLKIYDERLEGFLREKNLL